ncbi:MAG: hypothetical protein II931_00600 [Clostridia bacterium]|nr:hypothetical protein [Clostridia bacterium]
MKQMTTTAMREGNGGLWKTKHVCPFCGKVYYFGILSGFVKMVAYPAHLKTCTKRKRKG